LYWWFGFVVAQLKRIVKAILSLVKRWNIDGLGDKLIEQAGGSRVCQNPSRLFLLYSEKKEVTICRMERNKGQ